jgi:hypothetical protein
MEILVPGVPARPQCCCPAAASRRIVPVRSGTRNPHAACSVVPPWDRHAAHRAGGCKRERFRRDQAAGRCRVHPDKLPLDAAFQIVGPFRELINTHGDAVRAQFGVAKRDMWPDDIHARLYAPGRDRKLGYVFDEKMDPGLLSDLFTDSSPAGATTRAGLACTRGWPRSTWCRWRQRWRPLWAHPWTDATFDHVAVSGLTMDRLAAALLDRPEFAAPASANASAEREVEESMASLAFRTVVPVDPVRIPAEKIIEFRQKYAEERGLFQAELAKLAGGLAYLKDVNDPHEMEQHLKSEYDKTLSAEAGQTPEGPAQRQHRHSRKRDGCQLRTAIRRRRRSHRGGLDACSTSRRACGPRLCSVDDPAQAQEIARRFAEAVTRGISLPGLQTLDAQDRYEGDL